MYSLVSIDFARIYATDSPLLLSLYSRGILKAPSLLTGSKTSLGYETHPGYLVLKGKVFSQFTLSNRYSIAEDHAYRLKLHQDFVHTWSKSEKACLAVEKQIFASKQPEDAAIGRMHRRAVDIFALDFISKYAFPLDYFEDVLLRLKLPMPVTQIMQKLSVPTVMPHYLKFQQEYHNLRNKNQRGEVCHQDIVDFIRCYGYLETYDILPAPCEDLEKLTLSINKRPQLAVTTSWSAFHNLSLANREGMLSSLLNTYRERWGNTGLESFFSLLAVFLDMVNHEEQKRYFQTRIARNLRLIAQQRNLDAQDFTIEQILQLPPPNRKAATKPRNPGSHISKKPLYINTSEFIGFNQQACLDSSIAGSKAAMLAKLHQTGYPVPPGFLIPNTSISSDKRINSTFQARLAQIVQALDSPTVAVRSSFTDEDGVDNSYAGTGKSFLGLFRTRDIAAATVLICTDWNQRTPGEAKTGGVLVQKQIDAAVSGVLFESRLNGRPVCVIEAAPGLNIDITKGTDARMDRFIVSADGEILQSAIQSKSIAHIVCRHHAKSWELGQTRMLSMEAAQKAVKITAIHQGDGIALGMFSKPWTRACLTDAQLRGLLKTTAEVRSILKFQLDMEWAFDTDGKLWILQARPLTRPVKLTMPREHKAKDYSLLARGIGVSAGTAQGKPVILKNRPIAPAVRGEIVVADQILATQLYAIANASGIVTQQGGLLSHTSIVARELGIPCIVGVEDALKLLADEEDIKIDGLMGTITTTFKQPGKTNEQRQVDLAGKSLFARIARPIDFELPSRYAGIIVESQSSIAPIDQRWINSTAKNILPRKLYILNRPQADSLNYCSFLHPVAHPVLNHVYGHHKSLFIKCNRCLAGSKSDHAWQEEIASLNSRGTVPAILCDNPTLTPVVSYCPARLAEIVGVFVLPTASPLDI